MLFGKKKTENIPLGKQKGLQVIMHYEGLPGFQQDFPCYIEPTENAMIFYNSNNNKIKLPYAQLRTIDFVREEQFMGKYHNNPVKTGKGPGQKWFYVLTYTSSSGEEKYIALWCMGEMKIHKIMNTVQEKLRENPAQSITL